MGLCSLHRSLARLSDRARRSPPRRGKGFVRIPGLWPLLRKVIKYPPPGAFLLPERRAHCRGDTGSQVPWSQRLSSAFHFIPVATSSHFYDSSVRRGKAPCTSPDLRVWGGLLESSLTQLLRCRLRNPTSSSPPQRPAHGPLHPLPVSELVEVFLLRGGMFAFYYYLFISLKRVMSSPTPILQSQEQVFSWLQKGRKQGCSGFGGRGLLSKGTVAENMGTYTRDHWTFI